MISNEIKFMFTKFKSELSMYAVLFVLQVWEVCL